uniref:Uncharacterized protein n=1 Tax=Salmonella phage vB_SE130_2P TaxID=3236707 RepID=A0AB39C589_9VIRU
MLDGPLAISHVTGSGVRIPESNAGFFYRVFGHVRRQYRDIASYDVANSGDCHYLFPQGFKLPFEFGKV